MAEEQAPAKKMRFTSDFVTIKATLDDKMETFRVHEDIIKERSQYFRAAFDKKWAEGKAREIEIPDEHPETISAYLEFVYNRSASSLLSGLEPTNEYSQAHTHLARLYVFGEKIQDDDFCDGVMRALAARCSQKDGAGKRWFPGEEAVQIIYDGTPAGSPGRRFMVDMYIQNAFAHWFDEDTDTYHPEYLLDLVRALLGNEKKKPHPTAEEQVDKWLKKNN